MSAVSKIPTPILVLGLTAIILVVYWYKPMGSGSALVQKNAAGPRVWVLDSVDDPRFHNADVRHQVKKQAIYTLASVFGASILVETGTYRGEMVQSMLDAKAFRAIHSIELYEPFYKAATEMFRNARDVHLYQGDSATVLPQIISALDGPAVFWLDGHFSGVGTGRGKEDSPLRDELRALSKSRFRDHNVILIDDMRFAGVAENGYPTVDELKALVQRDFPNSVPDLFDDFFRIFPRFTPPPVAPAADS